MAEQMRQIKAALGAAIGPEPIGEWMREQGFPPESCMAILPLGMRGMLPIWPRYVRFSAIVASPTLVRETAWKL